MHVIMPITIKRAFLLLAFLQALHSLEEYVFELWDYLAPARIISGLVSDNLAVGFAAANAVIVALIFWTWYSAVGKGTSGSRGLVWFWAILETLNGAGHIGFGLSAGGYFPGLYSAPLLLLTGAYLLIELGRAKTRE